ncbi:AMP-binding enzyme domain-containing protein [Phthorimaea operculella]|nr:AMP-binding enzyme domain-containing protein [Phthorimaea operculella]
MSYVKVVSRSASKLGLVRSYSYTMRQDLWTPDKVVRSPFKDIEIPTTILTEHVWNNIGKWSDKKAVTCGVTNRAYTYSDLYKYSRTFAANLRLKFGINDGDIVCVMMPNSPEYVIATLGTIESGAVMTTVNPIYTPHEVLKQLNQANPKVIIASNETVDVIKQALKLAKIELPIIIARTPGKDLPPGTIDFLELAKENHVNLDVLKHVATKSEDVVLLPYSSGTTGLPKGVELTHRNIVVNCLQQDDEILKLYQDTTASHQDSVIAVLPFYHIYGLVIVMLHKLSVGAKIVTVPKFDPKTFPSTLQEHRINLLYVAPPLVLFLGKDPSVKKEHLTSARSLMSGAAPLHKEDIHRALDKMPPNASVVQLYGMTETSPLATANLPNNTSYTSAGYPIPNTEIKVVDAESKSLGPNENIATANLPNNTSYTSAGYPISNTEIKVVDAESKSLGPNEVGELWIRGPQVMKGYRNNPEATKNTITEDGWLKSGDMAFLEENGTVSIVDRLKELIKVKGFQVPPAELESLLKEHPAVLDAGVVGIPDERAGEVPKAFVVLKAGHKTDSEELKEFIHERVAAYKRIKEIVFLDALPKNPSGKLLRRVLKDEYC